MLVLNRIISDIQLVSLNIFTQKKANKNKKEKQKIFIVLGGIFSGEGGGVELWQFFLALMFTVYI